MKRQRDRGLKILFATYWSPQGWKLGATTPPEDFAYAKAAGYMFDPVRMSHDAVALGVCKARDALDRRAVSNAFLASLSTRQLPLRSALGSYAAARHFRPHAHQGDVDCHICGFFEREEIDLSNLNFMRHKWGTAGWENPSYMWFDLMQFAKLGVVAPSPEDVKLFRRILSLIGQAAPEERIDGLERRLRGLFPSNQSEREFFLRTLSLCGILQTPEVNHFESFRPAYARNERTLKWDGASFRWRGKHGIALEPLRHYFGHLDLMEHS